MVEILDTLVAAINFANCLVSLERFEDAKSLMRKAMPVVRRVHEYTLKMRSLYTRAIYEDPAATLDDLREAVNMLEDAGRTARRVLGGAHPITTGIERRLRDARAALRARETPPTDAREDEDLDEVEDVKEIFKLNF